MNAEDFRTAIAERFPDAVTAQNYENVDPWLEIAPAQFHDVCEFLRDDSRLSMNYLHCISGVDYLEVDPKKVAKAGFEPHLEMVYHLSSLEHRHRLVLKVFLQRWLDDRPGEIPELDSVADLWSTADWHEREVYDLCGVRFTGHPNLRRILCPEDWEGYPLRKDYEMPLEYHGIRGR